MSKLKYLCVTKDNFHQIKSIVTKGFFKKYNLILFQEHIYSETLTIPSNRRKLAEHIVKNHVEVIFQEIKNVCFSYNLFKVSKEEIKIQILCINSKKLELISMINKSCRIGNIAVIQLCYYNYLKKVMKKVNINLIFQSGNYIYGISNNEEGVFLSFLLEKENEKGYITALIEEINRIIEKIETKGDLYLMNIKDEFLMDTLKLNYSSIDLGMVDEEKILGGA